MEDEGAASDSELSIMLDYEDEFQSDNESMDISEAGNTSQNGTDEEDQDGQQENPDDTGPEGIAPAYITYCDFT